MITYLLYRTFFTTAVFEVVVGKCGCDGIADVGIELLELESERSRAIHQLVEGGNNEGDDNKLRSL